VSQELPGIAIGLFGDVMLGRMVAEALERQPPGALWDPELRRLAGSLDLVVCNLECCISSRGRPTTLIEGKPFLFRGPPAAVEALRAMNIGAVGLANNHALDFGEQALAETLELLGAAGIAAAGAGPGRDAARTAAVVPVADLRIGLIAVTDHPVEYAAAEHWGVALARMRDGPPEWLLGQITALRERCDLVIAFPHWGPNMTTRPSRWQRRAAAELHAAGADLVAGHSAHLFHGVGWNDGGPTLFDLGDVLDDYMVDPELRNNLGVLAIWRPRSDPELELVGLRLEYCYTRLAEGADADWIAARLSRACRELGTSVTRSAEQRFTIELRIGNRQ
jgi:poly-gamma-glutamate capsule biosynthesis protein CapA/YwtB (metallophosphatase superfamily)